MGRPRLPFGEKICRNAQNQGGFDSGNIEVRARVLADGMVPASPIRAEKLRRLYGGPVQRQQRRHGRRTLHGAPDKRGLHHRPIAGLGLLEGNGGQGRLCANGRLPKGRKARKRRGGARQQAALGSWQLEFLRAPGLQARRNVRRRRPRESMLVRFRLPRRQKARGGIRQLVFRHRSGIVFRRVG